LAGHTPLAKCDGSISDKSGILRLARACDYRRVVRLHPARELADGAVQIFSQGIDSAYRAAEAMAADVNAIAG